MGLQEIGWGRGLESSDSRYGYVVGSCGHDDELSGSKKCGEFLTS
jgi:hypothetical protein